MSKEFHSYNTTKDNVITGNSKVTQKVDGNVSVPSRSTVEIGVTIGNKLSDDAQIVEEGPNKIESSGEADILVGYYERNELKNKAAISQGDSHITAAEGSHIQGKRYIENVLEGQSKISQGGINVKFLQTIHVKQMHFTDDIDFDPSKCKVRKLTEEEVLERLDSRVGKIFDVLPYGKNRALIINNFEFSEESRKRNAAEKDSTYLENLLPQLGFKDPQVEHNKKRKEIEDIIANFTKNSMENRNARMLIIFIGSHGKRVKKVDHFMDADCDLVPAKDIVEAFHASKCPHLKDKPKLFLFQFCREDSPASDSVEDDSSETMEFNAKEEASYLEWFKDDLATDAMKEDEKKDKANMLLSYSTAPGCLSYRHKEKGTFYVSALCKVFAENAYNDEIRVMLDKLNQAVSDGLGKKYVQLAVYDGEHLERDLFFLPHSSNEK